CQGPSGHAKSFCGGGGGGGGAWAHGGSAAGLHGGGGGGARSGGGRRDESRAPFATSRGFQWLAASPRTRQYQPGCWPAKTPTAAGVVRRAVPSETSSRSPTCAPAGTTKWRATVPSGNRYSQRSPGAAPWGTRTTTIRCVTRVVAASAAAVAPASTERPSMGVYELARAAASRCAARIEELPVFRLAWSERGAPRRGLPVFRLAWSERGAPRRSCAAGGAPGAPGVCMRRRPAGWPRPNAFAPGMVGRQRRPRRGTRARCACPERANAMQGAAVPA
ncbi:unnamed protein product, partial [Pelagomonas calceolata]